MPHRAYRSRFRRKLGTLTFRTTTPTRQPRLGSTSTTRRHDDAPAQEPTHHEPTALCLPANSRPTCRRHLLRTPLRRAPLAPQSDALAARPRTGPLRPFTPRDAFNLPFEQPERTTRTSVGSYTNGTMVTFGGNQPVATGAACGASAHWHSTARHPGATTHRPNKSRCSHRSSPTPAIPT